MNDITFVEGLSMTRFDKDFNKDGHSLFKVSYTYNKKRIMEDTSIIIDIDKETGKPFFVLKSPYLEKNMLYEDYIRNCKILSAEFIKFIELEFKNKWA